MINAELDQVRQENIFLSLKMHIGTYFMTFHQIFSCLALPLSQWVQSIYFIYLSEYLRW